MNSEKNSGKPSIAGILQLHNDMLVNLTSILSDSEFHWKNKVICTKKSSGVDGKELNFTLKSGPIEPQWMSWWQTFGIHAMFLAENEIKYNRPDLSQKLSYSSTNEILWSRAGASDFIYLPMKSFDLAFQIGDWLSSGGLMLEIAYPMLVQTLVSNGVQVKELDLCTNWDPTKRMHVYEMAWLCGLDGNHGLDLIHPVKPGLEVIDSAWVNLFDKMTASRAIQARNSCEKPTCFWQFQLFRSSIKPQLSEKPRLTTSPTNKPFVIMIVSCKHKPEYNFTSDETRDVLWYTFCEENLRYDKTELTMFYGTGTTWSQARNFLLDHAMENMPSSRSYEYFIFLDGDMLDQMINFGTKIQRENQNTKNTKFQFLSQPSFLSHFRVFWVILTFFCF